MTTRRTLINFTVADKMIIADPCQIDQRIPDRSVAIISNCAGEWEAEVERDAGGIILLRAIRPGRRGQLTLDFFDIPECYISTASLFMGCTSNVPLSLNFDSDVGPHQPGSFLAVAGGVLIFFDRNGWAEIHVGRDANGRAAELTVLCPYI